MQGDKEEAADEGILGYKILWDYSERYSNTLIVTKHLYSTRSNSFNGGRPVRFHLGPRQAWI